MLYKSNDGLCRNSSSILHRQMFKYPHMELYVVIPFCDAISAIAFMMILSLAAFDQSWNTYLHVSSFSITMAYSMPKYGILHDYISICRLHVKLAGLLALVLDTYVFGGSSASAY